MSFEDDLKDVGDSIGKLVDNAVNSQDFQELNRKISDTINQFVYPNRKGPFRAMAHRSRPAAIPQILPTAASILPIIIQRSRPDRITIPTGRAARCRVRARTRFPNLPIPGRPPRIRNGTAAYRNAVYCASALCHPPILHLSADFRRLPAGVSPDCSAAAQRLVSIPYLQVRMTAR